MALTTPKAWADYLNTKATLAKEKVTVRANAIEAYAPNADTVVLPYEFAPKKALVLPAFESDGTTPTVQTFRFINPKCQAFSVTYTGNATV